MKIEVSLWAESPGPKSHGTARWRSACVREIADDDPMAVLLARDVTAEMIHVDVYGGRFRYRKADV